MAHEKQYTAKEVTIAVLKKAEELLKSSDAMKKYATEMSGKVGYKPSELGAKEKQPESTDKAYKEEKESAKGVKRIEKQLAPGKNPKEKAEGNNAPKGADPIDLGKKEPTPWKGPNSSSTGVNAPLPTKETAGWHGDSQSEAGFAVRHGDNETAKKLHRQTIKEQQTMSKPKLVKDEAMKKKYEGFKAVEASAAKSGATDPAAVAAAIGRKKYGKKAFQHAAAEGKKMKKDAPAMNAQMGQPASVTSSAPVVNKDEPSAKILPPKHIISAKLKAFMERREAKNKLKKGII